ncbi:MAG: hypothetical protein KDA71_03820 [Planctomycetales bacterium]|nr:hypothetical protein [Planctomycetales bacterium]
MSPRARRSLLPLLVLWVCTIAGCGWHAPFVGEPAVGEPLAVPENPIFVPGVDHDFAWNQIVDALDDDFRIEREQRVQSLGGILTEGRIETFPTTGSTVFEPWRGDSTPGFERWHATLQSIRRRASVRVTPDGDGYLIQVIVYKELEDVDRPERANAGGAIRRHDGTLVQARDRVDNGPITLGWIPQGRDVSLEQRLLADIRNRLTQTQPPAGGLLHH